MEFIDAHMHCGAIDGDGCVLGATLAGRENAASVILPVEHWTLSVTDEVLEALDEGDSLARAVELNEIYSMTAATERSVAYFASLDCWHDVPFGEDWVEACKEDAREHLAAGAVGFKDHVGKQWQGDSDGPELADAGVFAGAWTRRMGRCARAQSNRECARSTDVVYPLLTDEWREVVKYIVEELKAPVISHATTFYGADAECWDPMTEQLRQCAPMSREHLLEFAGWAEGALSESARRRFVVAHAGFMVPGESLLPRASDSSGEAQERQSLASQMLAQLDTLLATGVSVETAATKDFAALSFRDDGVCVLRDLFGRYSTQWIFGTDRVTDSRACLDESYRMWTDLLTGEAGVQTPERQTCVGRFPVIGLELSTPRVAECIGELPTDLLSRLVRDNFMALYETR